MPKELSPSYLLIGDRERPSNHYRIVGSSVEFSADGEHWRTLSDEDLKLHLALHTPLAPWLESRLGKGLTVKSSAQRAKTTRST